MSSASLQLTATTSDSLMETLSKAQGGETILLAGGDYGELKLWGERDAFATLFEDSVTLKSADASNPARFSSVTLNGVGNIAFDGIKFDYVSTPNSWDKYKPFQIKHSTDIAIRNSVFDGDVMKTSGAVHEGYGTGLGLVIGGGKNVEIENNLFHDWARAASFGGVDNLVVVDNEVHSVRSDGFNFVAVSHALVEGNRLHGFERSTAGSDHADMIQFWTLNTKSPSHDVVIRGNVFDSGGKPGTQTIFMRNEEVDSGRAGREMYYRDILIEDNVIRNAHTHGVTVGETDGLAIRRNTLLHDADAGDLGGVSEPAISVSGRSLDVTITGNIAHKISGGGAGWTVGDNLIVQRLSPNLENYYDDLFLNARADGLGDVADLRALPGGLVDRLGLGASATRFDATPQGLDGFVLADEAGRAGLADRPFAARLYGPEGPIDLSRATIDWDFGDGSAPRQGGAAISHSFPRSGVYEVTATIRLPDGRSAVLERVETLTPAVALDVGFDDGTAADQAGVVARPEVEGVRFVERGGRGAVRLGRGFVRWPADATLRHNDEFSLEVVFAKETASDRGMLVTYPGVLSIAVGVDHVTASVSTSAGGGRIVADRRLPAGRWITARLDISGGDGVARFWLNGAPVGRLTGLAGGVTDGASQRLTLGDVRGDSFPGLVDALRVTRGEAATAAR